MIFLSIDLLLPDNNSPTTSVGHFFPFMRHHDSIVCSKGGERVKRRNIDPTKKCFVTPGLDYCHKFIPPHKYLLVASLSWRTLWAFDKSVLIEK